MIFHCYGILPNGQRCRTSLLYRCKYCGQIGCRKNGCSNQLIKDHRCLRCGRKLTTLIRLDFPLNGDKKK